MTCHQRMSFYIPLAWGCFILEFKLERARFDAQLTCTCLSLTVLFLICLSCGYYSSFSQYMQLSSSSDLGPIYVHIYTNTIIQFMNFFLLSQYTFAGGGGVFDHTPLEPGSGATFRESIVLGSFEGGQQAVKQAISELRPLFSPDSYNILVKNCNHFADALCRQLLKRSIPG